MAPLAPSWNQPSHPAVQKVLFSNPEDFTTKSVSTVSLPPYALFAKLDFPPCTKADGPTYATVQYGKNDHLNLNSDLVYINHSCEPSVIFDTSSLSILAGPKGLKPGDELTFFYPSTEWSMAQGFDCFCGTATCKGYISGASNMKKEQLEGLWLNVHIREMLEERDAKARGATTNGHKNGNGVKADATEEALKIAAEAVKKALDTYKSLYGAVEVGGNLTGKGSVRGNRVGSRELSGEMGGDTTV